MNDDHDNDLRALFAAQRESESAAAPTWSARQFDAPRPRRALVMPWAFAAAIALLAVAWMLREPAASPSLARELPPLIDPASGELFASLASPPTTDFLLPTHLTIHIP